MTEMLQRTEAEICPTHVEQPVLAAVLDYWNAKRGTRTMPSRADINPLELKEYLGWVIILDVLPEFRDFRYRLVGTKVARYFGADGTGQTIEQAFRSFGPGAVKGVQAIHRKAARDRVPMRAHGEAAWLAEGYDYFDSLYLPLSDDGETVNMILSVFTFDYQAVQAKSASTLV
ncbi:PAS domain-containing protein [Parvibaculum sp.]|uniref:PAS domain-containing protein n=1 Tax=Parvibaculum sp. TaxID=2024848 RepID=UPI0027301571|nr:PAS domain-containing protein [Parvibaculum sp.]MDP1626232.1 PAS domain-containing protein [Parvibaculum sp.]MDP2151550.1 PAS domain-containing protein [Parvibaculum sp.]MDP3327353.1 PAS domain-containing protein [Parvibaculum sp.]